MDVFQFRGGRMLMQRIGPLTPVRQRDASSLFRREEIAVPKLRRRNSRSPESRGIWAFPYPLFDSYFASFQFELAMPKSLLALREAFQQNETYGEEMEKIYYDAYQEWGRRPEVRKRLEVKQFWVSGELYTHLGANHPSSEWQVMSIPEFARRLRKQYARDLAASKRSWTPGEPGIVKDLVPPRYTHRSHPGPWPNVGVGHLEVFLGRGARVH